MEPIVILGGGHAAAQLCAGLSGAKWGAAVHLVCEEPDLPYHRPPLSKGFLKSPEEGLQLHRSAAWYAEAGIVVHQADPAVAIDRAARAVRLRSGAVLPYGFLVIATGATARSLPHLPANLDNVVRLRQATDAVSLRSRIHAANQITIIGGGFIGLEVAATARQLGKGVRILESAPRLLARAASPELAEHVLQTQRAAGVEILLGVAVGELRTSQTSLVSVSVDGQPESVEMAILAIGSIPEEQLATAAGLRCENGILVDSYMRTSDPSILAIGDCTRFPESRSGQYHRLESVQNANDQARTALATLLGRLEPYQALPWFWSEQGSMRLQMAGLLPKEAEVYRRPGASPDSFSLLHYGPGGLCCVESVNAPADHLGARKLLDARISPDAALACDPLTPLKSLV